MSELRNELIENGIHYRLHGDYYFPDFADPEELGSLGKWADMHLAFMKEHQPHAYVEMLIADKLVSYLQEFNKQAKERFQRIIEQMTQAEGVTEQLKAKDQLAWVQKMNEIAGRAKEAVLTEMVYR